MKSFTEYEDISSRSDDYIDDSGIDTEIDEYEDFYTGRDNYSNYSDYLEEDNFVDIDTKEKPMREKKKKKTSMKKKLARIAIGVILIVLALGIAAFFIIYGKMGHAEDKNHKNQYVNQDDLFSDKNVTNILLLGVDAREGEKTTTSRSDSMMILSVDNVHKKLKLTSFLRDSYVEIPGHGNYKLNASCSWGGVDLVWDTLEYNFKIKIDNYMLVDFKAFEELIDCIGGVDVEVTKKEANFLNNTWKKWSLTGNKLHFDYGPSVHLNGEEALMFCRIRKLDSDFMRTERQRRTITAVKAKLGNVKASEVVKMTNKVLPLVETDITSSEMISLGMAAVSKYVHYDMESFRIPVDGTWRDKNTNAGASIVFDIDENSKILHDFIYNDINPENTTK